MIDRLVDTENNPTGMSVSAAIGTGSIKYGDTTVDTTPLRFDLGLGYMKLARFLGAGVSLGWERAALGKLIPDSDLVPPTLLDSRQANFDLVGHLGLGLGRLTLDGGLGYTFLNDNGLLYTASVSWAFDHHTTGTFEQVVPQVTIERSTVGYDDGTGTKDLVRSALLFRVLIVAPSRL